MRSFSVKALPGRRLHLYLSAGMISELIDPDQFAMPPQASLSKATAPTTLRPWLPDTGPETDRLFPLKRTGPSIHSAAPHHEADAWHDGFSAGNQIRFGPFLLDSANSRLWRDGREIRVRSQVFELIKVLASQLNREVSFAQLMAGVWKGINVSQHTVVVTVAEARKALAEYRDWIIYLPKRGYRLTVPIANDDMRIGWRMAQRCTREGLEKALDRFRVAAAAPFDRRPFDAITHVYLMLGACGVISPPEALVAFQAAYRQAVDLFGLTPALRRDRAHALHLFDRNREAAERELLESVREQEDSTAFLRLTILYAAQRRFDYALESLQRARALDRFDPGFPAAEMFFWLAQRDFRQAVRAGEAALEIQPYSYLDRSFYAQALEFSGRVDEALRQYGLAQTLAPDVPWLKALEAHCLASNASVTRAERLLAKLQRLREAVYVDSLYLVPVLYALNRRDEAFAELWRARHGNSASLYSVDVDPKLASFRGDQRFAGFRRGLFRS